MKPKKHNLKTEEEKLADEIIRAVKEVYVAGATPFATVSWAKGRRTLIGALKQYREYIIKKPKKK